MLAPLKSFVAGLWNRISEPRRTKVEWFFGYCILMGIGTAVLIAPPRSIEGVIGAFLSLIWALFVLVGGIAGARTVLIGWWWAERLAIVAVWVGGVIYVSTVIWLHFNAGGNRLPQAGWVFLGMALFYVRFRQIIKYNLEPKLSEDELDTKE